MKERDGEQRANSALFPDLIAGLKSVPGCLGVESAATESGKQLIFAWFENRAAALRWYYSDMHQGVMRRFFPNLPERTPLSDVDEDRPVLAIASITMADRPQFGETLLPISQIAIEIYQPASGGLFLGGRFAPESLTVPGLIDVGKKG